MKPISSTLRRLLPLLGAAAALVAFAPPSLAQQGVNLNGSTICSAPSGQSPSLTIDPAGNLNIGNCVAGSGSGGTPTAPTCVNSTISVNADAVAMPTISASCSGTSITGYTWNTITAGAPFPTTTPTGASWTGVTFPTATAAGAPWQYSVSATNAQGTSQTATVTVSVVPPGSCSTQLSAAAVSGTITPGTFQPTLSLKPGQFASYALPLYSTTGHVMQWTSTPAPGNLAGVSPLYVQFSVSKCPGDFNPPNPTLCLKSNTVDNSAMAGFAAQYGAGRSTCPMDVGFQYYWNVRYTHADGTNACVLANGQALGSCAGILTFTGGK